ncbi:lactose-binding lectin l-2-like [Salarias fasciatus]|uniref:Lactose-binding lectin l-2-like n=1 Tax=Salarias fasciatus TaxID=181472 RepID=A0A672JAP5_SALFA|nr:lactose-binding lectin l-2-like [Salarias fasciatus]XP_029952570.1 lactose-binding lectin l-2-like [Salarias fasciatus]
MMFFLFLCFLALGAAAPLEEKNTKLQRGGCAPFWFSFSGRCYRYVATEMTWADAEFHCVSLGANLVSIHSQEEQNFVKSLIQNFDPVQGRTWIGLTDLHKNFRWMWSDGSRVDFVFWNTGEPSNYEGAESCVETNYSANKKWNDAKCHETFPFVCASRTVCP